MNEHEAERIAKAINVLRPDWPTKSLLTLMSRDELARRPRRDVLVTLAWVASETNSATPARVLEAGPWWKAVVAEEAPSERRDRIHPPRRDQECTTHAGEWAERCRACATEGREAPYDDEPPERPDYVPAEARGKELFDLMRAQRRGVTSASEDA